MRAIAKGFFHTMTFDGELMYFIPRQERNNADRMSLVASIKDNEVSCTFEEHDPKLYRRHELLSASDEALRQLLRRMFSQGQDFIKVTHGWVERTCELDGFTEADRLRHLFQEVYSEQEAR